MDIICTQAMGTLCTMMDIGKKIEREKRAARLKQAREYAGYGGYRAVANATGWNENTYKSHEKGQNGFDITDARKYARFFKVSVNWLMTGDGVLEDAEEDASRSITDVPQISWVSAGQLAIPDTVMPYDGDFKIISLMDLPEGDWFALKVEGNSMNKISPPESVIIVNRRDRRLVSNACYIVADETGAATYKRYRPNQQPPFQPASYEDVPPPIFYGEVRVVGRVRRSIIEM